MGKCVTLRLFLEFPPWFFDRIKTTLLAGQKHSYLFEGIKVTFVNFLPVAADLLLTCCAIFSYFICSNVLGKAEMALLSE